MNEAFSDSPEDFSAGIPQALMMMNGTLISDATNLQTSRTLRAVVDAPFMKDEERLDTLFLATLTRKPSEREREREVLLASVKADGASTTARRVLLVCRFVASEINVPFIIINA